MPTEKERRLYTARARTRVQLLWALPRLNRTDAPINDWPSHPIHSLIVTLPRMLYGRSPYRIDPTCSCLDDLPPPTLITIYLLATHTIFNSSNDVACGHSVLVCVAEGRGPIRGNTAFGLFLIPGLRPEIYPIAMNPFVVCHFVVCHFVCRSAFD